MTRRNLSLYLAVSTRLAGDARRKPSFAFMCTVAAIPVMCCFVFIGALTANGVTW